MIVEVESEKNPEIRYTVNTETGECTCPHYQLGLKPKVEADGKRLECKHLRKVMADIAGK